MKSVGSYEAKTHLPQLLGEVEKGETITITKRGKPIARLVPAQSAARQDVSKAVEAMIAYRKQHGPTLGGKLTVKALIEEGRR